MLDMDNNYSSTDPSAVLVEPLSIPHFDEDATLLSARPVVPLRELKGQTRSRRPLIFGLTIVAAILTGAITATLLLIQNNRSSQKATEAVWDQPVAPSSGVSGGSTAESNDATVLTSVPEKAPQTKALLAARDSSPRSTKRRQSAAVPGSFVNPDQVGRPDDERDQGFEDERELRRAERRESRREARRERRRQLEQNVDDLLRIREIFEGSPRP